LKLLDANFEKMRNSKVTAAPAINIDVCAVITTYRPDNGFINRVELVMNQVGMVVIVDDGDSNFNKHSLKKWFEKMDKVILHHNPINIGIAASLNKGITIARDRGFEWFLTLDDDSEVGLGMVDSLITYLRKVDGEKPIGVIGMSWSQKNNTQLSREAQKNSEWSDKRGIITSGSMFSLKVYDDIGPFRNEFIIGLVDYDFCLRARAKGYRVIKINEIGFEHSLGVMVRHRLLCFYVNTYNHAAYRLYYGHRNSTILAMEYVYRDPMYSLAVLKYQISMFIIVLLFEQNKAKKIGYMLRGIIDGCRNRLGKTIPID